MGIIIDILLIIIIILSVYSGVRRGFVRSIMNLITFFVSFFCAWSFSPMLEVIYYEKVFFPSISTAVYKAISALIPESIQTLTIVNLFSDKPETFLKIIQKYNTDITALEDFFQMQYAGGTPAGEITEKVSMYIATPVATEISRVLAFLSIMFGIVILLKLVTLLLDAIFKLPVLNAFNRISGFILGAGCGVAYAVIIGIIIIAAIPVLSVYIPDIFTEDTVNHSVLLKLISMIDFHAMANLNTLL